MPRKPIIKTERPSELTSPNKGQSKTRRKMSDSIKEEDLQEPKMEIKRKNTLPFLAHPSTLIDCTAQTNRNKHWKEDGMKVTFQYIKTMTASF
jgi:hypothetical protein